MIRLRDLSAEQRKTLAIIRSESRRLPAQLRPKLVKAAIETGLVEANLENPGHGDGSSVGWRQETAESYGSVNRMDRRASVRRFFDEALKLYKPGMKAGDLAANVQRPLAAYRGRYQGRSSDAQALLGQLLGGAPGATGAAPGGENAGGTPAAPDRLELLPEVLSMLSGRTSPVDLAIAAKSVQPVDAPAAPAPREAGGAKAAAAPAAGKLQAGGGWGGSAHLIGGLQGLAKADGLTLGSQKRDPGHNASVGGAKDSDHLTTAKGAYAGDYGNGRGEDAAKENFAKQVARHYGVRFVKNSYQSGGTITVHGVQYRVQILYGDGVGHGDHVHVGIRRIG